MPTSVFPVITITTPDNEHLKVQAVFGRHEAEDAQLYSESQTPSLTLISADHTYWETVTVDLTDEGLTPDTGSLFIPVSERSHQLMEKLTEEGVLTGKRTPVILDEEPLGVWLCEIAAEHQHFLRTPKC